MSHSTFSIGKLFPYKNHQSVSHSVLRSKIRRSDKTKFDYALERTSNSSEFRSLKALNGKSQTHCEF